MAIHKVAIGFDVPMIDLVAIDPQPTTHGVEITRRTYSANRHILDEGWFVVFRWSVLEADEATLSLILGQFDLDGADLTANVTIATPEAPTLAINRFNGIAHRPRVGEDIVRREYFLRNLEMYVTDLEYAAG